jgi:DNA-binding NarL/FixJ family response regulator
MPPADIKPTARVLIVEDDYVVASQAETALTESGFEVVGIAVSVSEALDLAATRKPDFCVMDIRLKGARDGIEAALELRKTSGTRCIFATAHYDANTRGRAEGAAPLGWLPKPYTADSLVMLAKRAFREIAKQ